MKLRIVLLTIFCAFLIEGLSLTTYPQNNNTKTKKHKKTVEAVKTNKTDVSAKKKHSKNMTAKMKKESSSKMKSKNAAKKKTTTAVKTHRSKMKANNNSADNVKTSAENTSEKVSANKVNTKTNLSVNDKAIGKTTAGKTIYLGPRGGHYYINDNGNKVYIKKDK